MGSRAPSEKAVQKYPFWMKFLYVLKGLSNSDSGWVKPLYCCSRLTFVDPELSNSFSLDVCPSNCPVVSLARRMSFQMQTCCSRPTFVYPELSNALSLDTCRSKCTSVALVRHLSFQMLTCCSRSTFVHPELSTALSLDTCRSKCTDVALA